MHERARTLGARHRAWALRHKWWIMVACGAAAGLAIAPVVYIAQVTGSQRYNVVAQVPHRHIAIVFGAGVAPNGTPTPYLQRRIETAVNLYKAGKADILLMSGDNSTSHHNEPVAMARYAEKLGVPQRHIVLDYAGFNTYDSCYRAHAIFGVTQATLVSHAYHLPRAIWTCNHAGVQSIGLAAENAGRIGKDFSVNYLLREVLSTWKAIFQTTFRPKPTILGRPLQIH